MNIHAKGDDTFGIGNILRSALIMDPEGFESKFILARLDDALILLFWNRITAELETIIVWVIITDEAATRFVDAMLQNPQKGIENDEIKYKYN